MPDPTYYTFNRITTSIKRMPIRALRITADEIVDEELLVGLREAFILDLFHIESESSYSFQEITKPNSNGGIVTLAYRWEVKIYVPHNIYKSNNLMSLLDSLHAYGQYSAKVYLGTAEVPDVTNPEAINSDDSMVIDIGTASFSYHPESVEFRPRLIITFSGVSKTIKDMFKSS